MISYSQIVKKTDNASSSGADFVSNNINQLSLTENEVVNNGSSGLSNVKTDNTDKIKIKTSQKELNNSINRVVKFVKPIQYQPQTLLIKPYVKNIYCKSETFKWLHYKIDDNYFHYDYCVKLFNMLMKWTKLNNFKIGTSEDILLAKFISLMYLLSNKQGYSSNNILG